MLLHAESFDWIPTAADDALLADLYTIGAEVTIDDSGLNIPWQNGLTGGAGTEAANTLSYTIVGANTMIVGFHLNVLVNTVTQKILDWGDGSLRVAASGGELKFEVYDGAVLIAESELGAITAGESAWIEFKITFDPDPDTGIIVLGVDDSPVIRERLATAASAITPDTWSLVVSNNVVIDDWIIKDTLGDANNDFGGEAYVEAGQIQTRTTVLDDDTTQPFNHGASTLFYSWENEDVDSEFNNAHISESPPDEDVTYVVEPTTADLGDVHRVDFPSLNTTLGTEHPVTAVMLLYRARIDVAGSESFIPIRFDPSFDPGTIYTINDVPGESAEVREETPVAVTNTAYRYYPVILHEWIRSAGVQGQVDQPWTEDAYASNEYGYRSMA